MAGGFRCLLSPSPEKFGSPNSAWWRRAFRIGSGISGQPGRPFSRRRRPADISNPWHERRGRLGKPRWLPKQSAGNVQGLARFDHRKLSRRMDELGPAQMAEVKSALRDVLGLLIPPKQYLPLPRSIPPKAPASRRRAEKETPEKRYNNRSLTRLTHMLIESLGPEL